MLTADAGLCTGGPLLAGLTWGCLQATLERVGQRGNMGDLTAQPYYRFLQKTYGLHVAAQLALLYVVGGFPALVWGGAVRAVWVYHITWFVNSASHCWGSQDYGTGDLSRNNWCAACCRAVCTCDASSSHSLAAHHGLGAGQVPLA